MKVCFLNSIPAMLLTIICLVATVLIYRRTPDIAGSRGVFIAIISIGAIYLLGMILSFGITYYIWFRNNWYRI
ncbi:MAG: hypothetical protein ACLRY8_00120 [Clostridium butyricum]